MLHIYVLFLFLTAKVYVKVLIKLYPMESVNKKRIEKEMKESTLTYN